mmetsp:Transcript_14096/g.41994  ORF Transcript_14096/g.41994 Transcript_14096/m.41994 type:complete len:440 (+) Transcript_14096:934-2253(+)
MMQLSIMICCCCRALNSVHLPCRMRSTQFLTDGALEVNGAATEASPGRTMGRPWEAPAFSAAPSAPASGPVLGAPASYTLPCLWSYSRISRLSSAVYLARTALTAPACAMKPVSPRLARASHSSSSHRLCRALSSFCFSERNWCLACPACFVRLASTLWRSLSRASASCCFSAASFPFPSSGESSTVLTLPCPARSAKPTSACFSAPTSLPPSPHIRTLLPCRCSSRMTAALPCGVIRAYMRSPVSSTQSSGCAWTTASSASPVAISAKDSESSATFADRGHFSPRRSPVTTTHSAAVAPCAPSMAAASCGCGAGLSSRPGLSPSVMPHARAMCRAVSGESPVSIATLWLDSRSAPITSAESVRARHSKEMKPAKDRLHSTSSRVKSPSRSSSGKRRMASARTRKPLSARSVWASWNHAGAAPSAISGRRASGEPFTKQ